MKKKTKKQKTKTTTTKTKKRKTTVLRYGVCVASRKIWPRSMQRFLRNRRKKEGKKKKQREGRKEGRKEGRNKCINQSINLSINGKWNVTLAEPSLFSRARDRGAFSTLACWNRLQVSPLDERQRQCTWKMTMAGW